MSKYSSLIFLFLGAVLSVTGLNKVVATSSNLNPTDELQRILKFIPKDNLRNGRVSFLDETFKDWLTRTGELPPDFSQLPSFPFLPDPLVRYANGKTTPIKNTKQWDEQRLWMKKQLQYYITGTVPDKPDNLKFKILEEKQDGSVKLLVVELSFGPNHQAKLTAELMIPPGKGPFPVFLTQWSHREWAQIAVRRGYIGCIYAGADKLDNTEEYSEIWANQYDFTRLMRRAYGASRIVDYLYTLPYVDKDKIGITGHSRNGKTSLMAAAFDERIGACIPSSGGTGSEVPWRYCAHKYDVEDIALLTTAQPAWFHPRLRFFVGRENKLPVDQNFFTALIAPRGLMLTTALNENASNIWGIEQLFKASGDVYRFLKKEDNLAICTREGLHGVSANDIESYIDFFDYVFQRSKNNPKNKLYCDYSFEQWRKLSKEKVNPLKYEIKNSNGWFETPFNSVVKWTAKKAEIKSNIHWMLGTTPPGVTNYGPQQLAKGGKGERKFGTFITRPEPTSKMEVMAISPYDGFGESLFGYLYYPASMVKSPNKKIPVVVYLHEYDYSKGFTSMSFDHEIKSLLKTFTDMGVGVLMYDMLGFGNRQKEAVNFYERYPNWSKMGKMVTDATAAVEALSNLEFVDQSSIYMLGYSLGGTVGVITAALDERVAGVVTVAGFTPMRTNTLDRGTEGIKTYSHLHGLMPRLGFFVDKENRIPIDFDEIIASIAPRPILVIAPELDQDAHLDDIKTCMKKAETIYKLYNKQSKIQLATPNDYNRFTYPARDIVYKWFKEIVENNK